MSRIRRRRRRVLPDRKVESPPPDDKEVMVKCDVCNRMFKTKVGSLKYILHRRIMCKECTKKVKKRD